MADGKVKIEIIADDSDAKKKLDGVEDAAKETSDRLDGMGDSASESGKGLKSLGEAAEHSSDGLEDLGDSAEKSGDSIGTLDVAAGTLVANGISSLISGVTEAIGSLVNLAEETREYREDMAKLESAFESTGHTADSAKYVYEDFYAILGESDRAVEAVNHLAELTDNSEDFAKWQTIAAGVTGKFGDSLPLEGLTEAANETAKVGKTTGVLADALNWAAKDSAVFEDALGGNKKALSAFNKILKEGGNVEDAFSAALSKMSSEQERSAAITNTLNGLYADAADEYNNLTAGTQKARRATAEMEAAQARLGTATESVSTAWTEFKTWGLNVLSDLAEGVGNHFEKIERETTGLTEAQRELGDAAREAGDRLAEMKAESDNAAIGISTQYNYTQSLADELRDLADASGYVEERDRARVDFILGELKKATGEEYTMVDGVIGKYDELSTTIDTVINKKRASTILQEYEAGYTEAIKNLTAQEQALADAEVAMIEQMIIADAAHAKVEEAWANWQSSPMTEVGFEKWYELGELYDEAISYQMKMDGILDERKKSYSDLSATVEESTLAINSYEEASTLILQGEYEKGMKILSDYGNGWYDAAGNVTEASKEQITAAENMVIHTSVEYEKLERKYEANQESMTDAQREEMEKRLKNASDEAQKAREEYYRVGGASVEGIVRGAIDKDGTQGWNLSGWFRSLVNRSVAAAEEEGEIKSPSRKMMTVGGYMVEGLVLGAQNKSNQSGWNFGNVLSGLVRRGIEAAKQAADSHSPSRETMALGNDIIEGLIIGAEDKRKEAIDAFSKTTKDVIGGIETEIENGIKRIDKELERLDDVRTTANAKSVDAQKKALNKEKKALQEREKAFTEFSRNHEKQLSEMAKLEETYSKDMVKIQEKLTQDIEAAWKSFENSRDSRAESIVSSLSLFDEVEKREAVDGKAMSRNLAGQVNELERYNKAILELSQRNVNSDFLEEMLGLGVDKLPELQALVRMSDEELTKYADMWGEKNRLAGAAAAKSLEMAREETEKEVAGLVDAAKQEAEGLTGEYRTAMANLLDEVKTGMLGASEAGIKALGEDLDEYIKAGHTLMESVADGIEDGKSDVVNAAIDAVVAAIAAAQIEAGIKSDLEATVHAENSRYGRTNGAADNGMTELAHAVGVQGAGINSLVKQGQNRSGNSTVVLNLNGRELGRAVVDTGTSETVRAGVRVTGGATR